MSEFKREVRYTVIKHNQLTEAQMGFLKNCIHGEGIPTVECVVVESDWPEYEPVWDMLKKRAEGVAEDVPKDCPVCDGWGSVSTGIDEAPSTLCKACGGNGSLPK